jgi:DNA-binding transcriptional LysR family regulator
MLDLRLVQFRHFLLVVETKNYRLAAEQAFRSQPALSQSIRQLELQLGQALFESHKRTQLTSFGELCLPLIRELVAHIERASASMLHLGRGEGGVLRMAILPSVAGQWLSSLLKSYVKIHPQVKIQILAEDSAAVQRLVASGEVDFGISSLSEIDKTILAEPLLQDRFGVLCRTDHPLAQLKMPIQWEMLKEHTLIGNVMNRQLRDTLVGEYVQSPSIDVSNLPTLLKLIRDGFGVTIVPALVCPEPMSDLTFVSLKAPIMSRTIHLLTRVSRSLSPSSKAMVEVMHQYLQKLSSKGLSNQSSGLIKILTAGRFL